MELIERTQAALEGVTEGPWKWERTTLTGGIGGYDEVLTPGPVDCMSYCYGGTSTIDADNPERDREFIAAARTLVPELLDALIEARREVNDLSGAQADAQEFWARVQELEAKVRRLEGDS